MNGLFAALVPFLAILNPFALCLYMVGVVEDLDMRSFVRVLLGASVISVVAFWVCALAGDSLLGGVLGIRPAAMRIFGGIIFFVVGYNYVLRGFRATEMLRGRVEELPSAIALPYMIGAGTITQAILVGKQHVWWEAMLVLLIGMAVTFVVLVGFKVVHDGVQKRNEAVFERYVNILARLNGLLIGAISTEMVVSSLHALWEGPAPAS